ncbi:hypothetical protein [Marivita sp.]|jgi:hypothetical protein|uniref:hypothetical protein n=1 Tax=Marivita sp. TaxID=2003365 RepID=UPI003F6CC191
MCLTAEAFALFLNILAMPDIKTEPGHIVLPTGTGDKHWIMVEDEWCTKAPQIDRADRFATLQSK